MSKVTFLLPCRTLTSCIINVTILFHHTSFQKLWTLFFPYNPLNLLCHPSGFLINELHKSLKHAHFIFVKGMGIFRFFFLKFKDFTNFKGYFPFTVIMKYWLYSPMLYNISLSPYCTQWFVSPIPPPLSCPSPPPHCKH